MLISALQHHRQRADRFQSWAAACRRGVAVMMHVCEIAAISRTACPAALGALQGAGGGLAVLFSSQQRLAQRVVVCHGGGLSDVGTGPQPTLCQCTPCEAVPATAEHELQWKGCSIEGTMHWWQLVRWRGLQPAASGRVSQAAGHL